LCRKLISSFPSATLNSPHGGVYVLRSKEKSFRHYFCSLLMRVLITIVIDLKKISLQNNLSASLREYNFHQLPINYKINSQLTYWLLFQLKRLNNRSA
jgi:hypothetical protein